MVIRLILRVMIFLIIKMVCYDLLGIFDLIVGKWRMVEVRSLLKVLVKGVMMMYSESLKVNLVCWYY